ncbi:type II toxin-antitoxin system PemK/MazF family toxin [Candidatus Poribacteria bacterium]|nr:type II toxin-antitoxin system PemK/MazF family toxin [Candidatus Poribacteria bacterium]
MGTFVKGDVVVVPFPFSDLSAAKRRPALVVATLIGDDVILCQITSRAVSDSYTIPITDDDFATGGLRQGSNVRPNRLFTADSHTILYRVGTLKTTKVQEVVARIIQIISA